MTALSWPLGLVAAGLLLVGCAGRQTPTPGRSHASVTARRSMSNMSMAAGQSMPGASTTSAASVGKPTATALMICSDDIKSKIEQVLKLPRQPYATTSFANQIYTCTYHLPVGPMVLSVQHAQTKAAADTYYNRVKSTLGPTAVLLGLGQKAYGAPSGVAVVLKDNETLMVDARGVPAVFGADQQKRTDLANEIASDVLGCWTGD